MNILKKTITFTALGFLFLALEPLQAVKKSPVDELHKGEKTYIKKSYDPRADIKEEHDNFGKLSFDKERKEFFYKGSDVDQKTPNQAPAE